MLTDISELIHTVEHYLNQWFSFPRNKVFAQVTTVMKQQPSVRTMDLYHFTPRGSFIFLTNTRSPKWNHLNQCSNLSICLVNPEFGQIIVEGTAKLDTSQSNLPVVSLYWQNYLEEYWQNYYLSNSETSDGIPLSFGVMEIIPNVCQILKINKNDFLKGSRINYELQNGSWFKNQLPLL